MRGFIDLHNHVLPGLDDGPADLETAVALVEGLAEVGFTEIHPTPHQRAQLWTPSTEQRDQALARLRTGLERAGAAVVLRRAAGENMWDELFLERQADASYPTYEGDKAFLLEFVPSSPPPQLESRLFDFQMQHGRLPVIAHVERFGWLHDRLASVASRAAILVNLSAIGGQNGWRVQRRARKLLSSGSVHAVASDAHQPEDVRFCRSGILWIERNLGGEALRRFLIDAPKSIVRGEIP